jgi:hypothetical protein
MVRQIFKADSKNINITIPDEYVGKVIEVLTFEVDEDQLESQTEKLASIKALYDGLRVDLKDFVFDRDEANRR